jgi:asparagine synthase (glutamine-hydrolysing)
LEDAVARRMVADVPVGSFLSGGIDSSLVTALMSARSRQQVSTFAIGFEATGWNEAQHASAVAKHLGTQHEELYVSAADFRNTLREVPRICDEPFADNSMIPTILLSRMARRSVTVALSGDGGDELFVGYDRYADTDRLLAQRARVPAIIRSLGSNLNDAIFRPVAERWGNTRLERRSALLSYLLRNGDAAGFSQFIMSQHNVSGLLNVPCGEKLLLSDPALNLNCSTAIDRMTFLDTMSYLVDDILFKVDRASMSTSLEVRCPLLDHRVIELSWRFPSAAKCSGTKGKLPLRKILNRHVPQSIFERPKMGFTAPVEIWLKNELRDWAAALMTREMLADTGLLNVGACRKMWNDFASGGRGWNPALWNILMFQAWHQEIRSMRRSGARVGSLDGDRALMYSSAR